MFRFLRVFALFLSVFCAGTAFAANYSTCVRVYSSCKAGYYLYDTSCVKCPNGFTSNDNAVGASECYYDVTLNKNGFSGDLVAGDGTGCLVLADSTGTNNATLRVYYGVGCELPDFTGAQTNYVNSDAWSSSNVLGADTITTLSSTSKGITTIYAQKKSCASGAYKENNTTCSVCPNTYPSSEAGLNGIEACYLTCAAGTRKLSQSHTICQEAKGMDVPTGWYNSEHRVYNGYVSPIIMVPAPYVMNTLTSHTTSGTSPSLADASNVKANLSGGYYVVGARQSSGMAASKLRITNLSDGDYSDVKITSLRAIAPNTNLNAQTGIFTNGYINLAYTDGIIPENMIDDSDATATTMPDGSSVTFDLPSNSSVAFVQITFAGNEDHSMISIELDMNGDGKWVYITGVDGVPSENYTFETEDGYRTIIFPAVGQLPCAKNKYQETQTQVNLSLLSNPAHTSCESCSRLTTGGFYSQTDGIASTRPTQCFGTTTSKKFVKDARQDETDCVAGKYCPGGTKVYYGETGGGLDCPTGNYCTASVSVPTECELGTYQPSTGQASCLSCANLSGTNGFYNQTAQKGRTTANECYGVVPAGSYVPTAGGGAKTCDGGYYCTGNIKVYYGGTGTTTSSKYLCQKGSYCPAGASSQTMCPIGEYQPSTGQTSCLRCADLPDTNNFYIDTMGEPGAFSAEQCNGYLSPGEYIETAKGAPVPCKAGYFCSGAYNLKYGQTGGAEECGSGLYCEAGVSEPTPCPAIYTFTLKPNKLNPVQEREDLTYIFIDTAESIDYCHQEIPYGTYVDTPYEAYVSCPAGSYCGTMKIGKTRYIPYGATGGDTKCPSGSYQPFGGAMAPGDGLTCTDVKARGVMTQNVWNNFCSTRDMIDGCFVAKAGEHTNAEIGATAVEACAVGTYQPNAGQASCIKAASGHYVDGTGATSEKSCSDLGGGLYSYTDGVGSDSSSDCYALNELYDTSGVGQYIKNVDSSEWTTCPAGHYCDKAKVFYPNAPQPTACPTPTIDNLNETSLARMRPYSVVDGGMSAGNDQYQFGDNPTATNLALDADKVGIPDLNSCVATGEFENVAGRIKAPSMTYKTGRYQIGYNQFYYTKLNAGYYLTGETSSFDNYIDGTRRYSLFVAVTCPAGSFCSGYEKIPTCTRLQCDLPNNPIGQTSCQDATIYYPNSATGATGIDKCYKTTNRSREVVTASADEELCREGWYCPGEINVYYGQTGGGISCAAELGAIYGNSNVGAHQKTECFARVNIFNYLPAYATATELCPAGYYCPGGLTYWGKASPKEDCPPGYVDGGTGRGYESQCTIKCAAGTRVQAAYEQCTTPTGNWYIGENSVSYGMTSSVNTCAPAYSISGTSATDHDHVRDCKTTCGAGQYVETADTACQNVGAGYWSAGGTISQGDTLARNSCPAGYVDGSATAGAESQCAISVEAGHYIGAVGQNANNWSTCANWTYREGHVVNYGSTSTCLACPNMPAAVAGVSWSKVSGTGWASHEDCVARQRPANCSSGVVYKTAISPTEWGDTTLKGGQLTSSAGYYAPKNSLECIAADPGHFALAGSTAQKECAAGTYSSASAQSACTACEQGSHTDKTASTQCTSCLEGYSTDGTGATSEFDCHIHCSGGYWLPTANYSHCVDVQADFWAPASSVTQGSRGTRNQCPSGLKTSGTGVGADEEGDCGRALKLRTSSGGTRSVHLRSKKKTVPSLNVRTPDGTVFYANMSSDASLLAALKRGVKIKKDAKTYRLYNEDEAGALGTIKTLPDGTKLDVKVNGSPYETDANAWQVYFNTYNLTINGQSVCSAIVPSEGRYSVSFDENIASTSGDRCWCRINVPDTAGNTIDSAWVFIETGGYESCAQNCNTFCSREFSYGQVFRKKILDSIG